VLNPRLAYMMEPSPEMFHSILDEFKRMTDNQAPCRHCRRLRCFARSVATLAQN
jgi:hypothetical protein